MILDSPFSITGTRMFAIGLVAGAALTLFVLELLKQWEDRRR